MPAWEDFEPPGLAVWCDKTFALGGLLALRGEMLTAPTLIDAVGLIDAVVWFDHVVVDSTLDAKWPDQVADAIIEREFHSDERSELRGALVRTWNEGSVQAFSTARALSGGLVSASAEYLLSLPWPAAGTAAAQIIG